MLTIKLDFISRISKRLFLLFFMLTLLIYLAYALHSCLITNLQRSFQQIKSQDLMKPYQGVKQFNENNFISIYEKETVVRVVPLIQNIEVNETATLDGAPKYRFLRQQGLRPSRKFPDALIIGVKKGGTRALLEFVRLHPDVRAAGSEVHFFDRFYSKGFQWYRHHMPPTLEGQVTMEKTPSYFVTKEVPPRVYQMNSAMKLLVVVRDPVTRAISDYTQAVSKKMGMKQFEELAFLNQSNVRRNKVDISWGPVKIGMYAQHLERWLHYFPVKQLLFVSGERLVVDPAAEMARVQETRKPQVFYTF